MRLDALYTLPDDYLQKVDVASMLFSLESRDPLLDQDLVEWAMKLPLEWKLRGGTSKYLLRKLAYRYVPRQILTDRRGIRRTHRLVAAGTSQVVGGRAASR